MTVPAQVDIVLRQVSEALDRGATALVGGRHSFRAPFIAPVVLVDPPDDSSAVCEETFGPTLTVRTVRDVGEALDLANGRGFGLGASVFSRKSAPAIAQEVRAGMVAMNCALAFVGIPALPFGGIGQSGFGRVHGAEGLREFAVTKSYTRQLFTIPGLDVATLRLTPKTLRFVRIVMRIRHGR
jgi:aldehyde dehydrogenase (NAD+)